MKPSEAYLSVIDLFSILLPGATLVAYLLATRLLDGFKPDLVPTPDQAGKWVAFALASYAVGHYVFLLASMIDVTYDGFRDMAWPDKPGSAYARATELRRAILEVGSGAPMNTFSWAKATLQLKAPAAMAEISRIEADSKFFRSFIVVLAVIAAGSVWRSEWLPLVACLGLAALSYWRYAERRHQSTEWAYRYVITLLAAEKVKPT